MAHGECAEYHRARRRVLCREAVAVLARLDNWCPSVDHHPARPRLPEFDNNVAQAPKSDDGGHNDADERENTSLLHRLYIGGALRLEYALQGIKILVIDNELDILLSHLASSRIWSAIGVGPKWEMVVFRSVGAGPAWALWRAKASRSTGPLIL